MAKQSKDGSQSSENGTAGLSTDELTKLARLSKLEIGPSEQGAIVKQIGSILNYVRQLQRADLGADGSHPIEPMSHVHGSTNVFRPDTPEPHLTIDQLLKLAPEHSGRFIKTPLVVEQE